MTFHRIAAVVTLPVAMLGVALLASAPAQAGVIIPQVHHDGIIVPQVHHDGIIVPQVHHDGVIIPQDPRTGVIIHDAGIIMDNGTAFPPGPSVTDPTTSA